MDGESVYFYHLNGSSRTLIDKVAAPDQGTGGIWGRACSGAKNLGGS